MKYRIIKTYCKEMKGIRFFIKKKIPFLPIWLEETQFMGLYDWIVNFETEKKAEDYILNKKVKNLKCDKRVVSEIKV